MTYVPFNKPYATGAELGYLEQAIAGGHLSGNGPFTRRCNAWLERRTSVAAALLTHSGTAALEMAAILAEIGPGDEVIMPSFTFVSTANAFVLRGAVPVFVDVREDTLNLDERVLEAAITERTRAVVPVHYAGVGCEMDVISALAARHGLLVIEDAAHGLGASWRGRPLGSLGHMAALSFHETKNVSCGEGGALLLSEHDRLRSAEVVHEKGTDRCRFLRGEVDKYTWEGIGSSYPPSEINAAFLWAQLEAAERINAERMRVWERYHEALAPLESGGLLRRPVVPPECAHNAHMYYVLVPDGRRDAFIEELDRREVNAVFHYVPLHSSPAGLRYGRASGELAVTDDLSGRLVRLPLWVGMDDVQVEHVVASVTEALERVPAGA